MTCFRSVLRYFENRLSLAVQGSIQAYAAVTGRLPKEGKPAAWKEYNRSFEERVMAPVLKVLEDRHCSVPEVCHAALKLLDVGARLFEAAGLADVPDLRNKVLVVPLGLGRSKKKRPLKRRA